jgi:hypothetical protein
LYLQWDAPNIFFSSPGSKPNVASSVGGESSLPHPIVRKGSEALDAKLAVIEERARLKNEFELLSTKNRTLQTEISFLERLRGNYRFKYRLGV